MSKGVPKPKETMAELLARFVDFPAYAPSQAELTNERPKLRAAYTEFVKRKRKRA
jgi:hypothetical protein